jgi:hypothetical protein
MAAGFDLGIPAVGQNPSRAEEGLRNETLESDLEDIQAFYQSSTLEQPSLVERLALGFPLCVN